MVIGSTAETDEHAKTMSIPDTLMREWFELLTDRPLEEINDLVDPEKTHPRKAKEQLGKDIVCFYHGAEAAEKAASEWTKIFTERQNPTELKKAPISRSDLEDGGLQAARLVTAVGLAKSGNEAFRLVKQGSLKIGEEREKVTDPKAVVPVTDGLIVRVGAKRIVAVELTD